MESRMSLINSVASGFGDESKGNLVPVLEIPEKNSRLSSKERRKASDIFTGSQGISKGSSELDLKINEYGGLLRKQFKEIDNDSNIGAPRNSIYSEAVSMVSYVRRERLKSMGFEISDGEEEIVKHPSVPNIAFDFSATEDNNFLGDALRFAYEAGRQGGLNDVRQGFEPAH
jgi:hypothetical protein